MNEGVRDTEFRGLLREHFGHDASALPVVADSFELADHMNIQLSLDAYLQKEPRSFELVGIVSEMYRGLGLAQLVHVPSERGYPPPARGPVRYVNLRKADGTPVPAVERGLYLIKEGDERLALLVLGPCEAGYPRQIIVEVMATERDRGRRLLADVRTGVRQQNAYRGAVVSLSMDRNDGLHVEFHSLAKIGREQIILPPDLLGRIERHTIRFAQHTDKLRAMGRHLKRGILLHGPPGTGKTLTAMYLASAMSGRTTFLVTGRALGLIERCCAMARYLQPSMVVIEDVDLVAEERTRQEGCTTPVLFELLNQMDGLGDDADVLFVLTTNRPEILEPALASRPGRVDQAFEIPLPDVRCREQLFDLYAKGMRLNVTEMSRFVNRTEGVSAAFVRELMRKAAVYAIDEGVEVVEDRHLDEALRDQIIHGGEMTKSLLGARGVQ
jgi:hypothetical protein